MQFELRSILALLTQSAISSISRLPQGAKPEVFLKRWLCSLVRSETFKFRLRAEFAKLFNIAPCTWTYSGAMADKQVNVVSQSAYEIQTCSHHNCTFMGEPSSFGRQAVEQANCVGVGPFSTATTQRPHCPAGVSLG